MQTRTEQKNYDVKGGWDNGLDWANIPKHIESPTLPGEKLWQTIARLGNDLFAEASTEGVARPSAAIMTEARDVVRFTKDYGGELSTYVGEFLNKASDTGLNQRETREGAERFAMDILLGGEAQEPADANPAYTTTASTRATTKPERTAKHPHLVSNGCGGIQDADTGEEVAREGEIVPDSVFNR